MFSFILSTILNNVGKQGRKTETPDPSQDIEPDNIFEDPFIDAAEDHNPFVDGGEKANDDNDKDGVPDDVDSTDSDKKDTGVDDDSNEAADDNSQSNESDYERESDYDEQEDFEEQSDYDEQDDWEEQHESLDDFPYDDTAQSKADSQEGGDRPNDDSAGTEPELQPEFDDGGDIDNADEYTEPLDLETILDETVFDDPEPFQDFLTEVFEDIDQMMDHDEFVPEFNIDQWIDAGIDPFDEFMRNTF